MLLQILHIIINSVTMIVGLCWLFSSGVNAFLWRLMALAVAVLSFLLLLDSLGVMVPISWPYFLSLIILTTIRSIGHMMMADNPSAGLTGLIPLSMLGMYFIEATS